MAGLHGPVGKLSRRLGVGLTPKGEKVLTRRPNPPGQHGARARVRKLSDYGIQLLEKQKLRAFYGLRERQFRNLFEKASRQAGATGDNLVSLLERRLDNVVFRQGLAATRAQARQLVNHGHFTVNGKKIDIPSYQVRPGDLIEVRERSRKTAYFADLLEGRSSYPNAAAEWLVQEGADRLRWKIAQVPTAEQGEQRVKVNLVVEFYSR